MEPRRLRVLLVDDDEDDYMITRDLFSSIEGNGFELEWVSSYESAASAIGRRAHDAYLIDYRLADGSGLDLLRDAISMGCRAPIILLTGQGDHAVDEEAMRLGAADYLVKGQIGAALLERSVRHAVERAHTLEALRTSEERFRLLIDNSYDIITILDPQGTVLYQSPSLERILGYPQDELIGKKAFDYVHPDDLPLVLQTFNTLRETGAFSPPIEFRFLHKDGTWYFLESVGKDLVGDPRVGGVVVNSRDVTERRRAQEALQESEEKYRTILENIEDGYYEVDLAGNFTFFNDALTEIFGYDSNELLGINNRRYLDEETTGRVYHAYKKVLTTGEPTNLLDYEVTRKDGEVRSVEVSITLIKGASGDPKGFRGIIRDVTERKRAESLLAGQKRILEMIAQGAQLPDVLEILVRMIERQSSGMSCSVSLFDQTTSRLRIAAAPSLPAGYKDLLDGMKAGQQAGSCGTAAYRKEPVFASDIATDPLWNELRDVALGHNLRACWSIPILSNAGEILGTFAMHYREPRFPGPYETQLMDIAKHLAGIAIERKRAEEALKQSEAQYRDLFQNANDVIFTHDLSGRFTSVNNAAERSLGYSQAEATDLNITDVVVPEHFEIARNAIRRQLRGESQPPYEIDVFTKSGARLTIEVNTRLVSRAGEPFEVQGIARDITERKRAEEALRKSETSLARAQHIAHLGNWEMNLDTNEVSWSDELYRIFGLPIAGQAMNSEQAWQSVHPDDRKVVRTALERAIKERKPYGIDYRIILPDGSERIVHEQADLTFDAAGRPLRILGTVQDITDRKRMEEAVRTSELQYRNLFESANDAIMIFEPQNEIILAVNSQACEIYGFSREELVGMSLKKITKDVSRGEQHIYKLLRTRTYRNFETVHFRKDGAPLDILANSAIIEYDGREAILSINRDVTERKRLHQQLIQSEKMAALGQLVSGVAHELNNPLTSVIGYAQLVLASLSLDPQTRERLEIINREAERTKRIVSNLLSFARQHKSSQSDVDMNDLLVRTLELRSYEMRVNNISVERDFHPIPKVRGDEHQLQQVFLNVIINAEHAIRSKKERGALRLKTDAIEENGMRRVVVKVADDGPGISPEHLEKLFDPFFTTKPVGKGTGLGLSITYGIVKEHGGTIRAENNAEGGATFTIELPALVS